MYSRFAEFLPLIYPPELEVKETTDTASSASFLDLYLEFDDSGRTVANDRFVKIPYGGLHDVRFLMPWSSSLFLR
jgi:hypothetical protein